MTEVEAYWNALDFGKFSVRRDDFIAALQVGVRERVLNSATALAPVIGLAAQGPPPPLAG